MSTKSNKPKSPPTPSRPLGDCLDDVRKLYGEYSHGKFAKSEIASKLSLSATSGPFAARLYTLKAFGLLDQNGTDYSVSDAFMTLNSADPADAKFKQTALDAIRSSGVFKELLDEFKNKLPSTSAVAGRLENEKRFNAERAKAAATVLEKSLRFAGVLDGSNNILPVRDITAGGGADHTDERGQRHDENLQHGRTEDEQPEDLVGLDTLTVDIPVGDDRKVVIRYPRNLSADEATKVGNVLNAIVG